MAVLLDSARGAPTSFGNHDNLETDGHQDGHLFHYPSRPNDTTPDAAPKRQANGNIASWTPDSDIRETKIAYHIEIELAGLTDMKDILIQWMSSRTLMVEGKTRRTDLCRSHEGDGEAMWESDLQGSDVENETHESNNDDDGGVLYRCPDTPEERTTRLMQSERKIGSWRRSFTLPIDADMKTVKAALDNGLLHISVFKKHNSTQLRADSGLEEVITQPLVFGGIET
jgi:HSP20 family molecular chaperone IbpA